MIKREEAITAIENLKKELKTWEKVLQVIDRSGLEERTGTAMRFYRARPSNAVKSILRTKGVQTQEQLMKELEAGGIAVGKKRGMHNTRIALEKTMKTGALKKVGDMIGLPEWPDHMFAAVQKEKE